MLSFYLSLAPALPPFPTSLHPPPCCDLLLAPSLPCEPDLTMPESSQLGSAFAATGNRSLKQAGSRVQGDESSCPTCEVCRRIAACCRSRSTRTAQARLHAPFGVLIAFQDCSDAEVSQR